MKDGDYIFEKGSFSELWLMKPIFFIIEILF
jgi:hypothetical protein